MSERSGEQFRSAFEFTTQAEIEALPLPEDIKENHRRAVELFVEICDSTNARSYEEAEDNERNGVLYVQGKYDGLIELRLYKPNTDDKEEIELGMAGRSAAFPIIQCKSGTMANLHSLHYFKKRFDDAGIAVVIQNET